MASVLSWFGLLQFAKAACAAILVLRTYLSIDASDAPEHSHGRLLLKAIALFSLAGLMAAVFWEFVFFGDNLIPYRSWHGYQWGLLALAAIAEIPFFAALWILWRLMDLVRDDE